MKAIARSQRITSKKLNLVAELVRLKNVVEAISILKFTPKKAAKILYKVVSSAMANAENNFKQERSSLYVQEVIVTEGATLKRSVPVSRGRVNPILKRTAHVTVILNVKGDEAINAKNAPATTETKTTMKEAPKAAAKKPAAALSPKKKITKVKA